MALQKEIPTSSGVAGNYLRILKITDINFKSKKATVIVGLFLNKEASDAGKSSLLTKNFEIELADPDGNIRKQAYEYIKKAPSEEDKKKPAGFMQNRSGKFGNVDIEDSKDV